MTVKKRNILVNHLARERRKKNSEKKEKSDVLRLTGNILGFLSTMQYGFVCNESNALLIMVLEFLLKK